MDKPVYDRTAQSDQSLRWVQDEYIIPKNLQIILHFLSLYTFDY